MINKKKTILLIAILGIVTNVALAQYVKLDGKQFKDENGNNFYPICMNYIVDLIYDPTNGYYFAPYSHYDNLDWTFDCSNPGECMGYSGTNGIFQDLDRIKNLGFNTVHLVGIVPEADPNYPGFSIAKWGNPANGISHYYFQLPFNASDPVVIKIFETIDEILEYCHSIGLKVIIDGQKGDALDSTREPYYNGFLELFANHINNSSSNIKKAFMAYILVGEPLYDSDNIRWRNKENVCNITSSWYQTIKNFDPNHLVGSGGMNFMEVFEYDPGVMKMDFYFPHFYTEKRPFEETLGVPNYAAQIERIKTTLYWLGKNCPVPWMVGETGFSARDMRPPPYGVDGSIEEQKQYFIEVLNWVRNCGGSGFSAWQYQDVGWGPWDSYLGLLYKGELNNYASLKKPALDAFISYLDGNGNPPPIQSVTMPNNYYDHYNHAYFSSNTNIINGHVQDYDTGLPIKDAVIWGNTKLCENCSNNNTQPQYSGQYTFTDENGNFTLIPFDYDNLYPYQNTIETMRISAIGSESIQLTWPNVINNQTYALKRNQFNYDGIVSSENIATGTIKNFQSKNTLTLSNVVYQNGSTGEIKAKNEVNIFPNFNLNTGSEVHIYTTAPLETFPFCYDYLGYRDKQLNTFEEQEINKIGFEVNNVFYAAPNPTKSSLEIIGEGDFSFFEIFDSFGQLIFKGDTRTVLLNSCSSGIYVMRVYTKKGKVNTIKLIKY